MQKRIFVNKSITHKKHHLDVSCADRENLSMTIIFLTCFNSHEQILKPIKSFRITVKKKFVSFKI